MSSPGTMDIPKWQVRTGWVITILCGLFLLMDGTLKVIRNPTFVEGTVKAGYPADLVVPIGVVLLVSTVLFLVPRTAPWGALFLTAYLGGATATHVRLGQPFWFPMLFGVLVWAALCLRIPSARELFFSTEGGEG